MNITMLDNLIRDTEARLHKNELTEQRVNELRNFVKNTTPTVEKNEDYSILSKLYELKALTQYDPNEDDGGALSELTFDMAVNLAGAAYNYDVLVSDTAKYWAKNWGGIHSMQDRFTYGPWHLGYGLEEAYKNNNDYEIYGRPSPIREMLSELEGEELNAFLSAGARLERKGEKIYGAIQPVNNYMLSGWDSVISTYHGNIYKIGLTYQLREMYLDLVILKISNDLSRRVADPKSKKFGNKELVFDGDGVRVRVQQRKLPVDEDVYQINIIAKDTR